MGKIISTSILKRMINSALNKDGKGDNATNREYEVQSTHGANIYKWSFYVYDNIQRKGHKQHFLEIKMDIYLYKVTCEYNKYVIENIDEVKKLLKNDVFKDEQKNKKIEIEEMD